MHYDAVFHFDNGAPELNITIANLNNYFEGLKGQEFSVVLVVNGPGIKLMGKDGEHADKLAALLERGLKIRVCRNAMNKFELSEEWLCTGCEIIPGGLFELVDLQRKGYAYIKP